MNIEKLQGELNIYLANGRAKDVTKARGRLIEAYKKEINKLLNKDQLTSEEKDSLLNMKTELEKEVAKHKIQLSARYSNEFINEKANLVSVFTNLPNAVSIAVEKVKTCIGDIKNAKDSKEKAEKKVEALKSVGSLAATPFVYLGKFALDQWYAVAGCAAVVYFVKKPEKLLEYGWKAIKKVGSGALSIMK